MISLPGVSPAPRLRYPLLPASRRSNSLGAKSSMATCDPPQSAAPTKAPQQLSYYLGSKVEHLIGGDPAGTPKQLCRWWQTRAAGGVQ